LPDIEHIRRYKILAIFGERLFHPALWGINRHTVAKGVAIGLFCGLIPGPFQMLFAALVCLFLRGNLPLAALLTLYTNPFTILPLYFLAYHYGAWALGNDADQAADWVLPEWVWSELGASLSRYADWLSHLGAPLGLGLVMLASTLGFTSYVGVTCLWNWRLHQIWQRRQRQHTQTGSSKKRN
jgi:uncharacterized protein (DUF2062 family)